jgi:hypothetical protein
MIGGLSWNEDGNPAFCCLVNRRQQKAEETLETPKVYIEIVKEIEAPTLRDLFDKLNSEGRITDIYAQKGAKYNSFIRDFMDWKRQSNPSLKLKCSSTSSFEAGVLKIKELVLKNEIKFPEQSKIRSQLRIFSKLSLKSESQFYAVGALTNVIGEFRPRPNATVQKDPKLSAWY